jgi:hypothetical protein
VRHSDYRKNPRFPEQSLLRRIVAASMFGIAADVRARRRRIALRRRGAARTSRSNGLIFLLYSEPHFESACRLACPVTEFL